MISCHLDPPPRRRAGFTLVEIMIVVVIIGLLAAIAIPAFQRVQHAAQISRMVNDFRVFSQAFEGYCALKGTWPANAGPGVVPAGMSKTSIKVSVWQATTAIGGRWNWDQNISGFTAGVSVSNFTCTDADLQAIDAKLDDGDLSTGNFRKVSSSRVMYILEP
jgi:prepilin-type N-terminal cleavage/methylation domain-containing protein